MTTLVSFHAHPDDESIATAGTIAKAAAAGHRVVLVFATKGEQGKPQEGVLDEGEQLWERRVVETERSAEILGAARVEFLGYEDSEMMGEPENDNPACFWQADVEEAAQRLAAILRDEDAGILTVYDDHGGYGHPDHIQVHRVGHRAAELAGTPRVFESTMNRDHIRALIDGVKESGPPVMGGEGPPDDLPDDFGTPAADITHGVDVTDFVATKRRSMAAHRSQISPDDFFLAMPEDTFVVSFGTEWYIEPGAPRAEGEPYRTDLFAS